MRQAPLEVAGHERCRRRQGECGDRDERGDQRQQCGTAAAQNAGPQARAADDHGCAEQEVQEHEEGQDPGRDNPASQAGAAQRPRRKRDAARARRREQSRRGKPGERDLVARYEVDPRRLAGENGAEEDDVSRERADLEHDRDSQPLKVGVLQRVDRLADARQARQHEVHECRRGEDERGEERDLAPRQSGAGHLFLAVPSPTTAVF